MRFKEIHFIIENPNLIILNLKLSFITQNKDIKYKCIQTSKQQKRLNQIADFPNI